MPPLCNNQKDAAVGLGFILAVVLAIIFGNSDWIGACLGLGGLALALLVVVGLA